MRRTILQIFLPIIFPCIMGCDITQTPEQVKDSYEDYLPKNVSGRYACTNYVQWPDSVIETDSTERFSYSDSGTYSAILVRTTWVGNNPSCSVVNGGVIGGNAGIKRYFGRWKNAPQNPNYTPPTVCFDCDFEK